jgi:hypothetical protein
MAESKRLVRVVVDVGYVVYADDAGMVSEARDALYEDVMNAVKYNELSRWIKIVPAPDAEESDIPDFLKEQE